jgi:hypothetical protein
MRAEERLIEFIWSTNLEDFPPEVLKTIRKKFL